MKAKPTTAESKGMKMIQALQAAAGITESDEAALAGWRAMTAGEQEQTRMAHHMVCGKKKQ